MFRQCNARFRALSTGEYLEGVLRARRFLPHVGPTLPPTLRPKPTAHLARGHIRPRVGYPRLILDWQSRHNRWAKMSRFGPIYRHAHSHNRSAASLPITIARRAPAGRCRIAPAISIAMLATTIDLIVSA